VEQFIEFDIRGNIYKRYDWPKVYTDIDYVKIKIVIYPDKMITTCSINVNQKYNTCCLIRNLVIRQANIQTEIQVQKNINKILDFIEKIIKDGDKQVGLLDLL